MNCPKCGLQWPQSWQQLDSSTALTTPPANLPAPAQIASAYRKTPYRKMELAADVLVPFLQAVVTGSMTASAAALILPSTGLPWWSGLHVGVIVTAAAWGFRLAASQNTLWVIEEILGQDINQDGDIGQPAPQEWKISAAINEADNWKFADLAGRPSSLHALALAVLGGHSFAERTATDNGYTQAEFYALRDELIKRNLATWNHPTRRQNGVSLLRGGMALMRAIAATPPPNNRAI